MSVLKTALDSQKAASELGFDWHEVKAVFDKVREELDEVKQAHQDLRKAQLNKQKPYDQHIKNIEEEIGDLFFATLNLARHLNVAPEQAIQNATNKFESRLDIVKSLARDKGVNLQNCTEIELENMWNQAKSVKKREQS